MSKIPKILRLLGHDYSVKVHHEKETGNTNLGSHWGKENKIWINSSQCQEMMESCLLHECIEGMNFHLILKLDHKTICRLETAFYQLFKENPSWITKRKLK